MCKLYNIGMKLSTQFIIMRSIEIHNLNNNKQRLWAKTWSSKHKFCILRFIKIISKGTTLEQEGDFYLLDKTILTLKIINEIDIYLFMWNN